MKTRLLFIALLTTTVVFTSCKKDKDPEAVGVIVPNLKGKIVLNEQYGGVNYADRAGATALLSGQFQTFTATTDDAGRFQFSEIPSGTYSISVSKEGFSTMQINNFSFIRNTPTLPVEGTYQILPTLTLGKKSTVSFDSTAVTTYYNVDTILFQPPFIEIDTISVDVTFFSKMMPITPNPSANRGYRLYISNSPNVSPSNFKTTIHGSTTNGYILKTWTQQEWQSFGLSLGNTVYVLVHGDSTNEIFYLSPSDQKVYPNLSDASAIGAEVLVPFN
jgi:hypothetical protein